jgi:hypothetical protein
MQFRRCFQATANDDWPTHFTKRYQPKIAGNGGTSEEKYWDWLLSGMRWRGGNAV